MTHLEYGTSAESVHDFSQLQANPTVTKPCKYVGILYQSSMVKTLLDGLKQLTRRVAGKLKGIGAITDLREVSPSTWAFKDRHQLERTLTTAQLLLLERCPYGQPGNHLWVREAHYLHGLWTVAMDAAKVRRWVSNPNVDMGVQFDWPNGLITGRSTTVAGYDQLSLDLCLDVCEKVYPS